jgi:hypothetical protein
MSQLTQEEKEKMMKTEEEIKVEEVATNELEELDGSAADEKVVPKIKKELIHVPFNDRGDGIAIIQSEVGHHVGMIRDGFNIRFF